MHTDTTQSYLRYLLSSITCMERGHLSTSNLPWINQSPHFHKGCPVFVALWKDQQQLISGQGWWEGWLWSPALGLSCANMLVLASQGRRFMPGAEEARTPSVAESWECTNGKSLPRPGKGGKGETTAFPRWRNAYQIGANMQNCYQGAAKCYIPAPFAICPENIEEPLPHSLLRTKANSELWKLSIAFLPRQKILVQEAY